MSIEQTYVLDGPKEFFFGFPVRTPASIQVEIDPGTVLPPSEYQVVGASATSSGVTIIYPNAPTDGLSTLRISRQTNVDRVSIFLDDLSITARALNAEFDNILEIVQDGFASALIPDLILKPVNVSPADQEEDVTRLPTLETDGYFHIYGREQGSARWQISKFPSFTTTEVDVTVQGESTSFELTAPLEDGQEYYWRVQFEDEDGALSEFSDRTVFFTTEEFVNTPVIISPTSGASGIGTQPLIATNAFSVSKDQDVHVATQWVITRVSDDVVVFDSGEDSINLTQIIVPPGVLTGDPATQYVVKARHFGQDYGPSLFSPGIAFTVDVFIEAPTITQPQDEEIEVGETPTIEASPFVIVNASDTHAASNWVITRVSDNVVVFDSGDDTTNLTSIEVPPGVLDEGEIEYEVKVRYQGAQFPYSAFSDPVSFTTQDQFFVFLVESSNRLDPNIFVRDANDITIILEQSDHIASTTQQPVPNFFTNGFLYIGSGFEEAIKRITVPGLQVLATSSIPEFEDLARADFDDNFIYASISDNTLGAPKIWKLDPLTLAEVDNYAPAGVRIMFAFCVVDDHIIAFFENSRQMRKVRTSDMTEVAASSTFRDEELYFTMKASGGFVYGVCDFQRDDENPVNPFGIDLKLVKIDPDTLDVVEEYIIEESVDRLFQPWRRNRTILIEDGFVYVIDSRNRRLAKVSASDLSEEWNILTSSVGQETIQDIAISGNVLFLSQNGGLIKQFDINDGSQIGLGIANEDGTSKSLTIVQ